MSDAWQKINLVIVILLASVLVCDDFRAQSTFVITEDTVVTEACTGSPVLFDTIRLYNLGDKDVDLNWELIKLILPQGGGGFLIIDPAQYPALTGHSHVLIHSADSSQIIFHVWPDTLHPGDSVIWQLHLFDPADSTNIDTLVTAIVACPLSSVTPPLVNTSTISVYPNPFSAATTIDFGNQFQEGTITICDLSGKPFLKMPIRGTQMELDRSSLVNGIYIMHIMTDSGQTVIRKFVVTD